MLPFAENGVINGDTIYLAIHGMYVDRIPVLLAAIPQSLGYLSRYRLMIMAFGDHLEQIRLFDETSGHLDFPTPSWSGGGQIDPVVGLVMTDHASYRNMKLPTLFLFSDGNLITHWNPSVLSQVIKTVWLNEPTDEPLLTPFGMRYAVNLQVLPEQPQDQPWWGGKQPDQTPIDHPVGK